METQQVSVVLAEGDLKELLKLTGETKNSYAIRAAVIEYLRQNGINPQSTEVKHGGHKKPNED